MSDEAHGSGDDHFDHNDLGTLGHALRDAGRGLVRFGADYPYLDEAEREISRQRVGRIIALINALWPRMDAEISADHRAPITSPADRDKHEYHIEQMFKLFDAATKPKEDK